jgi:hypothetical protein
MKKASAVLLKRTSPDVQMAAELAGYVAQLARIIAAEESGVIKNKDAMQLAVQVEAFSKRIRNVQS